ncbi:putative protein N(5)-glutamine methyltransferase [Streptosporangium lutulentum]|uniref:Release factor glutamine methyltransferase n=1 Tax=Streptosporangium lutulentum TaxID=1461250 RepID=A0ABT9QRY1_9ACTN|nr:putative protein N(5)-glutamine methyltransferase [Streptosporangium lutulentum]MDP9848694.1 release factor glutamine methyltransferase [Streptosporangium lutulentum]
MSASPSPLSRPLASPAPLTRSVIVTTLRAAGCVFAEDEAELLISTAPTPADLAAMVDRRVAGLPLEHVLGWAEFCGLRIAVNPGVFVPRRRTEFLARQATAIARQTVAAHQAIGLARQTAGQTAGPTDRAADSAHLAADPAPVPPRTVVVDLCCGSGAVGAALVAALDRVELHAVDIDPAEVRCARRNVAAAGGQVYEGDLYEPLPDTLRGRVDVLVASAPYVPTEAIGLLPAEARVYEPWVALDGGADGLDIVRRVIADAPQWLAPGGHLLVETSERQAPQTVETFTRNGLIARVAGSDELEATVVIGTLDATVVIGTRPALPD